jgi:hypothetical protein
MIFILFIMNFGILNEFTGYLNMKLISEKGKMLKQSWADFRSKATWRWPGPEKKTVGRPMPSGTEWRDPTRSPRATSTRWRGRHQQDERRNAAALAGTPQE